jgi:hypothetical protein
VLQHRLDAEKSLMANLDPRASDGATVSSGHSVANAESLRPGPAEGNHAPTNSAAGPDPTAQPTRNGPDDRSGLDRAEEVVDYLAERISSLTSKWGREFLRLSSRARESAQDFWAEVQDFRQGKKP